MYSFRPKCEIDSFVTCKASFARQGNRRKYFKSCYTLLIIFSMLSIKLTF